MTAAAPTLAAGTRVALVPPVLALQQEYASGTDPIAEIRSAAVSAVGWAVAGSADGRIRIIGSDQGRRVLAELAAAVGASVADDDEAGLPLLVAANGSATRTEKAPGFLDERAAGFDERLGTALRSGDRAALADLDLALGRELWAEIEALQRLGAVEPSLGAADVDYDDAPFGVQYWVMRWVCGS